MLNVVQLCLAGNNILLIRKWNHTFLLLAIALSWKWHIALKIIIKKKISRSNDKTIMVNLVITKYCHLSVSRRSTIFLSLWLQHITDLLATDKSQYFPQPCPIIVKYLLQNTPKFGILNIRHFVHNQHENDINAMISELTPIAAKTIAKLSLWSSMTPFLNFTKPACLQIWAAI